MKTTLIRSLIALSFVFMAAQGVQAHSYNPGPENEFNDPLRIVALPVHAIGTVIEVGILRPIHKFVSQPCKRRYFGHVTNKNDRYDMREDDLQRSSF